MYHTWQSSVCRAINAIIDAVGTVLPDPPEVTDLNPDMEVVADGRVTPIKSRDKGLYSFKKKNFGLSMQVVTATNGAIVYLSEPVPATVCDKTALEVIGLLDVIDAKKITADRGYQGTGCRTPIKKKRQDIPLEDWGKEDNKKIGGVRYVVEAAAVELAGTKPIRVGRTSYVYDALGRVVETVTRRLSAKPVVKRFSYVGSTGQVAGVWSSDTPGHRWVYAYDGLGRRVSKTCVDVATGVVVSRVVFAHVGDVLCGEWTTVDDTSTTAAAGAGVGGGAAPGHTTTTATTAAAGVVGRVWVYDPETGVLLGQVDYTPTTGGGLEAEFYAVVTDLAGAPRELVDPDTGTVVGRAIQSVFGRRRWEGIVSSPLLFTGQYEDTESGWVYNRHRFYDPVSGVYGAQDPLGVVPNLGTAQGYVVNPLTWVDPLGLKAHVTKAPPFLQKAHNKGVVGEQAVDNMLKRNGGSGRGRRISYIDPNTGGWRFSDGHVGANLIEVKNVKSLGYSAQIRAAVQESVNRGGKLDLYVARETQLDQKILDDQNINIHRIPRAEIVQASKDVWHSATETIWV